MQVQVKILDPKIGQHPDFPLPKPATPDAAGIDLRACIDAPLTVKAGETVLVGTGLAIFLADCNYVGLIMPRSGLGHKHGIVLGNLTGVIDADYQGELMVSIWNRSQTDYTLQPGERMAQYLVVPVMRPTFSIVEAFSDITVRGKGGFGSSGSH